MNPEKKIKEAVKEAQNTLARYVEPGERDCEATINKLLDTLDDTDVVQAVNESDAKEGMPGCQSENSSSPTPVTNGTSAGMSRDNSKRAMT